MLLRRILATGEDVNLSLCLQVCRSLFDEVEEDAAQEEICKIIYEVTAGEDVSLSLFVCVSLFDEVDEDATQKEIDKIVYEVTACLGCMLVFLFVCVRLMR